MNDQFGKVAGRDEELRRRLAVIWTNYPPYRYVPKAISRGPEWRVLDRKTGKLLKTPTVKKLSFDDCIEKLPS